MPRRADVAGQPGERGREAGRVGERVREQRAAALAVAPEAGALVRRLPVGLEQEVAGDVRDEQYREDLDPGHVSAAAGTQRRLAGPDELRPGGSGRTRSLTATLPRTTRTFVPSQRSSVSHCVPRTVAAP